MIRVKYLLLLFLLMIDYPVASNDIEIKLCTLNWILGTWRMKDGNFIITETWEALNENNFEGSSMTINDSANDTTFTESLRVIKMGTDIFYLAKVAHNEFPVAFKLNYLALHKVTFQNLNHDFPQEIIYELLEANKLKATTEGFSSETGTVKTVDFYFTKDEKSK